VTLLGEQVNTGAALIGAIFGAGLIVAATVLLSRSTLLDPRECGDAASDQEHSGERPAATARER
jgi:hypothetical protein